MLMLTGCFTGSWKVPPLRPRVLRNRIALVRWGRGLVFAKRSAKRMVEFRYASPGFLACCCWTIFNSLGFMELLLGDWFQQNRWSCHPRSRYPSDHLHGQGFLEYIFLSKNRIREGARDFIRASFAYFYAVLAVII